MWPQKIVSAFLICNSCPVLLVATPTPHLLVDCHESKSKKQLLITEQQWMPMVYLMQNPKAHVCHLSLLNILPVVSDPEDHYCGFFKEEIPRTMVDFFQFQ